jgi:NIPSNAP
MITCCIRYTLDPHRVSDFEEYARRWPPIIARCGGELNGYFLPKEGANNFAIALIDFESLAAYEIYRAKLAADPDARANVAHAMQSRCILVEERSFLRRA